MNTTPDTCFLDSSDARVLTSLVYSVVFVVSLVGNILVVVVVHRNKALRNSTNYFIVNMACSDLIVPIVVIPRVIKEVVSGSFVWEVSGTFGEALCKTIFFLSDTTPVVSILSLVFLSLDRLHAVAFPMRKSMYSRRVRAALIAFTWLTGFGVFAPYFYGFKLASYDGVLYCNLYWGPELDHVKTHEVYTTFLCVAFIIIPFVVLAGIYVCICVVLLRSSVAGDSRPRYVQARKARKVVKLAVTVVFVCGVCWCPYGTLLLLLSFKWNLAAPMGCAWQLSWLLAQFLAFSNAAVNPTIYFLFIQSYRQELKRVVSSCGTLSRSTISNISRKMKLRTTVYELNIAALSHQTPA